ncbi:MAG: NADPH-dependent 7-cyano-7-deazaguanine reductase QueF [Nitrososphaerota archaeon]|jgi:7-cyano-7-deazaguanine reductase|nr:NADPH-dependent 7-cyano-7-deazaguanine reductase QueF [Nitrososphaerota archaeon]
MVPALLETKSNKNRKHRYVCNHTFSELTAVCPVTRLPDFYTVNLAYEPDRKLVELKSLKMYFVTYRNVEILHEEITNQILDDFVRAVNPRWASIEVQVNNRGGITTTIVRRWTRKEGDLIDPRYAGK